MIKPIELFPGALVQSKQYGIMKVIAVGYEKIVAESKYFYEEEFFLEEIKPIRLTPKMAKKLGFRRKTESSHEWEYYKRGNTEIWFHKGRANTVWYNERLLLPVEVPTVHQLQRILAEKTRARIDFSKLIK